MSASRPTAPSTARRSAAEAGAELAAVNQFLATAFSAPRGARPLAADLDVEPGCELAVAAALGPLLRAALAGTLGEAGELLDGAGRDGASALVAPDSDVREPAHDPPVAGARHMLDVVRPGPAVAPAARRLLADAWLVDSLDGLPAGFAGIAATAEGRVLFAARRASCARRRPAATGACSRTQSRRERLVAASEQAARGEAAARPPWRARRRPWPAPTMRRERAEGALRAALRERDEAAEVVHRADWLIDRRRTAPADGPAAVRRAELVAELRAERRLAEQAELARAERRPAGSRRSPPGRAPRPRRPPAPSAPPRCSGRRRRRWPRAARPPPASWRPGTSTAIPPRPS